MKTFETPAGKVIQMKRDKKTSLIRIEFASGGELPESLSSLSTTEREAEIAIMKYLDTIKDKKSTSKAE